MIFSLRLLSPIYLLLLVKATIVASSISLKGEINEFLSSDIKNPVITLSSLEERRYYVDVPQYIEKDLKVDIQSVHGEGDIYISMNLEPVGNTYDYHFPYGNSYDTKLTYLKHTVHRDDMKLIQMNNIKFNTEDMIRYHIYIQSKTDSALQIKISPTVLHSILPSETLQTSTLTTTTATANTYDQSLTGNDNTVVEDRSLIVEGLGVDDDDYGWNPIPAPALPIITLNTGISDRRQIISDQYQYYKYTLTQPLADMVIALTVFDDSDPDLYVAEYPNTNPTRTNYTYMSAAMGADTLLIQAVDNKKTCIPNLIQQITCDYYIGVYSWLTSSSYSIVVSLDYGYYNGSSVIKLRNGRPQTGFIYQGRYAYFDYAVNATSGPTTITTIPNTGFDVDIYVSLSGEPGKNHFDYSSTNWGSEIDTVTINCPYTTCIYHIAVFGYTGGEFVITAVTNDGVVTLQSGKAAAGTVEAHTFKYYKLACTNQFAVLSFALTVTTGDADLYINTHKPNTTLVLPTVTSFYWRSIHIGNDQITIDYATDGEKFCYNCEYIVGVSGYKNTTYTLLATSSPDTIIRLSNNRPQASSLNTIGAKQYFSVMTATSEDDLIVTLSPINTGTAEMYVQIYDAIDYNALIHNNTIQFPDPTKPTSYIASTSCDGTNRNYLVLPGPYSSNKVFVILVYATTSIQFTIVVRVSTTPITLQAGIPQNHFLLANKMEYFQFIPTEIENLKITVTPRTGDPDLYISSGDIMPSCVVFPEGSNMVECSNITWISRQFSTDQILISHSSPCEAMLSTTLVSLDCDPATAYRPGTGQPINIGVFGYTDSQFTITVTPSNNKVALSAGVPQYGIAEVGVICTERNSQTEICLDARIRNQEIRQVLLSTFTFRVNSATRNNSGDVIFNLKPQCNSPSSTAVSSTSTSSSSSSSSSTISNMPQLMTQYINGEHQFKLQSDVCIPGCACNPFQMYINACPASQCTIRDKYPSGYKDMYDGNITALTQESASGLKYVDTSYPLVFSNVGSKCDPSLNSEDCIYYITVFTEYYYRDIHVHPSNLKGLKLTTPSSINTLSDIKTDIALFELTAMTSDDTTIIPCSSGSTPDGIVYSSVSTLSSPSSSTTNNMKSIRYEYCASPLQNTDTSTPIIYHPVSISIEQCVGRSSMYICADDGHCNTTIPYFDQWAYYSTNSLLCEQIWGKLPNSDQYGWIRTICTPNTRTNTPHVIVRERIHGNYFILVNGTGQYKLVIQQYSSDTSLPKSPILVSANYPSTSTTLSQNNYDIDKNLYIQGDNSEIYSKNMNMKQAKSNLRENTQLVRGMNIESHKKDNTLKLTFKSTQILFPGILQSMNSPYISYSIYAIDINTYNSHPMKDQLILSTICGLQYAATTYPTLVTTISLSNKYTIDVSKYGGLLSFTLSAYSFPINKPVNLTLVATCDATCLRQSSKILTPSSISSVCSNNDINCNTQWTLYNTTTTYIAADPITPANTAGQWVSTVLVVFGSIITVILLIAIVFAVWWMKVNGLWESDYSTEGVHYRGLDSGMQLKEISSPLHHNGPNTNGPSLFKYSNLNTRKDSFSAYIPEHTSTGYVPPTLQENANPEEDSGNVPRYAPSSSTAGFKRQVGNTLSSLGQAASKIGEKVKNVTHMATGSSSSGNGIQTKGTGIPALYSGMTVLGQASNISDTVYTPLTTHPEVNYQEEDDVEGERRDNNDDDDDDDEQEVKL